VKVILTRAHRDLVRALFELEVPEISEGIINIRRIEREPGYRTKLAVDSTDAKVDCVGACVGVRGTRIKSIIDELNGERIDIIRWTDEPEQLIVNALKPAEISHIELDEAGKKALVLVDEDQLSLAIGRKGQNVRLASKLTHWDIDIMTRAELEQSIADEDAQEEAGDEAAATDEAPGGESPAPGETDDGETAGSETAAGETSPDPIESEAPDATQDAAEEPDTPSEEPSEAQPASAETPAPASGEPERDHGAG
jgi:N utilization substance protein A